MDDLLQNDTSEEYEYMFEYDYDESKSHSTFNWEELSPMLVMYGFTFLLGLSGNALIIYATHRYRRMHSVTNILLSSLASADLLLIIFCIPVKVAKLFSYTWAFGAFLCKFVHYVQNVSTICSVLTLTAISVERYYAIVHPMRAKYICTISQVRRIIGVTWILSFLLAVPILFVQIQMDVGKRVHAFWCVRDWDNRNWWQYHELYMMVLVLIVPFCIMLLAYSLICWEVWNVMERRSVMTSKHALSTRGEHRGPEDVPLASITRDTDVTDLESQETQHRRHPPARCVTNDVHMKKPVTTPIRRATRDDSGMVKQVICMLVAVVLLFAICWGPLLIDNVLTAYKFLPKLRTGYLKSMNTVFHLLAYFNSCINPVIYGFMSKSFRESFTSVLCCTKDTGMNNGAGAPSYSHRSMSRMTSSVRHISRTGSKIHV